MAPALIASKRSSSSSLIVSMMIRVLGTEALIARVASIPLLRGIRTSMSMTSGVRRSASSTASWPSLASPTTSMSASAASAISRLRRISA